MTDDSHTDPTDAPSDDTHATESSPEDTQPTDAGADQHDRATAKESPDVLTEACANSGAEAGPQAGPLESDRYAHLTLPDERVVIYDRDAPESWLQSDFAVTLGA